MIHDHDDEKQGDLDNNEGGSAEEGEDDDA